MNNNRREGILLGRDGLGRGVLLTPEGDYCRAFVAGDARPGDIVRSDAKPSAGLSLSLSAASAGVALILICFVLNFYLAHPVRIAGRIDAAGPSRGNIYATLYLKSKAGAPVALDLDRQGRIVTIRTNGERLPNSKAIGRPVADVLEDKDGLLTDIQVEPGEPLGLQIQAG